MAAHRLLYSVDGGGKGPARTTQYDPKTAFTNVRLEDALPRTSGRFPVHFIVPINTASVTTTTI